MFLGLDSPSQVLFYQLKLRSQLQTVHIPNIVPLVAQTRILQGAVADWPCQISATHFPVAGHVPLPTWKI